MGSSPSDTGIDVCSKRAKHGSSAFQVNYSWYTQHAPPPDFSEDRKQLATYWTLCDMAKHPKSSENTVDHCRKALSQVIDNSTRGCWGQFGYPYKPRELTYNQQILAISLFSARFSLRYWCRDIRGSTVFGLYLAQLVHFSATNLCSELRPGHHANPFALARHLQMPWCPSWSFINISDRIPRGISSLLFFSSSSFANASYFLVAYSPFPSPCSLWEDGHPFWPYH